VVLLRLELRLAVRLDIGELRLTEGVTSSRKMAMNVLEGRLKKLRKADANLDTLLWTAPGDLTSMITDTEAKNNIAKSAAKNANSWLLEWARAQVLRAQILRALRVLRALPRARAT
jgi:hypothetical protein